MQKCLLFYKVKRISIKFLVQIVIFLLFVFLINFFLKTKKNKKKKFKSFTSPHTPQKIKSMYKKKMLFTRTDFLTFLSFSYTLLQL